MDEIKTHLSGQFPIRITARRLIVLCRVLESIITSNSQTSIKNIHAELKLRLIQKYKIIAKRSHNKKTKLHERIKWN